MNEKENVELVRQIHAALLRRDAEGFREFLNGLAPDVEWWAAGPPDILPWAGMHRGHEGVTQFFTALRGAMEYLQFEPGEFIAQDDTVVMIVQARVRARATGRTFESGIVRISSFLEGKVALVRNYYDTAAYVAAIRGA